MKIGRVIGLAPGELGALFPALAAAFACVGANILSTIAGDTLFLSAFSIEAQGRFYVVSAIVRLATSLAFASIAQRFLGRRYFDPLVVLAAACSLAVSAALAGSPTPAVVYLVCVAQLVLPPLLPLIAFNASAGTLDARAARRLLPLIGAASTLGALAAATSAGLLAHRVGLGALFLGAAGLALAAVAALLAIRTERRPRRSEDKPGLFTALGQVGRDVRDVPAVRIVLVVGLAGAILMNLVDFAFRSALKEHFDREGMARYISGFTAAANAAILVFQLALTGRIVGRLGVREALRSGPLAMLAIAPALFVFPPVAVTTLLRFVENVFRYAIGNSVTDLLLVPISAAVRTRAKLIVKAAASPLGALASGLVISLLGAPDRRVLGILVAAVAATMVIALRHAREAYATALASTLGGGRAPSDVSPEAVRVYRSEVERTLMVAVAQGNEREVSRALDLMSDRFFSASDLAPVLRSHDARLRRLGIERAIQLTSDGDALLAAVETDADDALEVEVLEAALARHGAVPPSRLERALGRGETALSSEPAARLWATGLVASVRAARDAQPLVDAAVKQLRKGAIAGDSPKRAAALRALGDLGERRAVREIQNAIGSSDPRVFAEAARAAVLIEAPGTVPGLVASLTVRARAVASARALALAGPRAVRELVDALPTTRGEGAVAATAIASTRTIAGTVRAAHVLARIGRDAADHVLPVLGSLGYRARVAVARAFGASPMSPTPKQAALLADAIDTFVSYAETLTPHLTAAGDLLARETERRIAESIEASLALASVGGDRVLIARARTALRRTSRERQNALALLEAVLPQALSTRLIGLADTLDRRANGAKVVAPPLDGWLEKCRLYDRRELPLADPMRSVLDRVLALRQVELFQALSAEELFPVAEIALTVRFGAGEQIVEQGEAAEELFVVLEGECEVVKDGASVGTLTAGRAFGELSVLDGEPRAATVRAKTQAELLRISRMEFEALLDESPELAKGVIKALLGYVRRK